MQYQEELQPSFSDDSKGMIDIESIVPYLDNPPQFDIITNKVQNFGYKPPKKCYVTPSLSLCSVSLCKDKQIKYNMY